MKLSPIAILLLLVPGLLACPSSTEPHASPSAGVSTRQPPRARQAVSEATEPQRCGAFGCALYGSPADAFRQVLKAHPRVLAVGEAHALKSAPEVASATQRFRLQLLPLLKGKASDFLVELLVPRKDCKRTTAKVKRAQRVVTKRQRKSNQNEFLKLAQSAKTMGMVSHPLRPSCAAYAKVVRSGPDAIARLLTTIAELSALKLKELARRNRKAQDRRMVVAYGGTLHNDLSPPKSRAAWSFGPQLQNETKGGYVAVDLIVPQFIKATPTWKALPWYAAYRRGRHPHKTWLFRLAKGDYVLIFPEKKNNRAGVTQGR